MRHPLVDEAIAWCKTVPPSSRWWIDDGLFEMLHWAVYVDMRYGAKPVVGANEVHAICVRTVTLYPKKWRHLTCRP